MRELNDFICCRCQERGTCGEIDCKIRHIGKYLHTWHDISATRSAAWLMWLSSSFAFDFKEEREQTKERSFALYGKELKVHLKCTFMCTKQIFTPIRGRHEVYAHKSDNCTCGDISLDWLITFLVLWVQVCVKTYTVMGIVFILSDVVNYNWLREKLKLLHWCRRFHLQNFSFNLLHGIVCEIWIRNEFWRKSTCYWIPYFIFLIITDATTNIFIRRQYSYLKVTQLQL